MAHPLLLHSVSYAGLWGQAYLDIDKFVDKAAELGYDGVMLMAKRPHVSVLDYGEKERAALRGRLEARRLGTVVIAGYNNFTGDLEHGDIPHREIQIQYITELARLARDLSAGIVRVFTGYDNPASTQSAQWNLIVASLKECSRRAADLGVVIGVQNHHDMAAGWETMLDLVAAVNEPNCRALFDAWAPALHHADIVEAARKLGTVTAHTTIADYQLRPRYKYHPQVVNYTSEPAYVQAVPMGDGFIDYAGFLSALGENGFTGSVAYEMCSPLLHGGDLATLDRYARRFLEYMSDAKLRLPATAWSA